MCGERRERKPVLLQVLISVGSAFGVAADVQYVVAIRPAFLVANRLAYGLHADYAAATLDGDMP